MTAQSPNSDWPPRYPEVPKSTSRDQGAGHQPGVPFVVNYSKLRTPTSQAIPPSRPIPGTQSSQVSGGETGRIYISLSASPNTRHAPIQQLEPPSSPPRRPLPVPPSSEETGRIGSISRNPSLPLRDRRPPQHGQFLQPPSERSISVHDKALPELQLPLTPGSALPPRSSRYSRIGLGINKAPRRASPTVVIESPPEEETKESAPNIAQRLESRLWDFNKSNNVVLRWLLEIVSWILSLCCMVGIVVVLFLFKDQRLPAWPLSITPNTLVSILSRVATAGLLVPTSEALGQLKWQERTLSMSWFRNGSKKMWDFEIFDNASRGPWGSFMLLVRLKCRSLAAIGAAITILSLGLDPFFQQVISFEPRPVLSGNSSIARTNYYDPGYPTIYSGSVKFGFADLKLQPVAQSYFFDFGPDPATTGNGARPNVPYTCSATNCTWSQYDSLGFCSKCTDVSDLLQFSCMTTRVDWSSTSLGYGKESSYPNATVCGYFLNATSKAPVLMNGYVIDAKTGSQGEALDMRIFPLISNPLRQTYYGGSINFKQLQNPLQDFIIATAPDGPASVYQNSTPVAHECILTHCVKTFESSLKSYNGTLHYSEEVVSEFYNTTPGVFPWQTAQTSAGIDTHYISNITIEPPGKEVEYGMSNSTVFGIEIALDDFFPSTSTVTNASATRTLRYILRTPTPYTRSMAVNPWAPPYNVTQHMSNMASSLTDGLRSASKSHDMWPGEAWNSETYVAVRWLWLVLPFALLFLSLVLLIATVVKSSRELEEVGVWKNSAIATLLNGLPDEMQRNIVAATKIGTPRAKARELRVKLLANTGWRMSNHILSPTFAPDDSPDRPGWV